MQIRPIRTDKDHRAALAENEKLWVASIGTPDDAARRAAEDALLDRTALTVSLKAYAEFLARLDAPLWSGHRVIATLDHKSDTLKMIWRLHEGLGIPAESLIKVRQEQPA
jgi:HTH-type transcriptional regulator / antitoxin HigA